MPRQPEEKKEANHTTTLQLPERWYEELRRRAFDERKSLGEVIREALRDHYGLKAI